MTISRLVPITVSSPASSDGRHHGGRTMVCSRGVSPVSSAHGGGAGERFTRKARTPSSSIQGTVPTTPPSHPHGGVSLGNLSVSDYRSPVRGEVAGGGG